MPHDADGPPLLVSRTATGHLSIGQCLALALGAASLLTALWGVVLLVRGVIDDGIGLTVGGLVLAVVSAVVLLRLRRTSRQELQVRRDGLVLVRAGRRRGWRWSELHDVYVVAGIDRLLTLEGEAAVQARDRAPRAGGLEAALGGPPPLADTIALRGMEPGEHDVLAAIARATDGRLPSPERGPRLPGR